VTTDRAISVVEDEPQVIEAVGMLKTTRSTQVNDDFLASSEDFKNYEGTSPTFKRRMTRQINKARGGAGSKQLEDKEFITAYEGFGVVEPPHNMDQLVKLYTLSAPHYAAVNAKVNNIVGLGYRLVENSKTKRNFEKIADDSEKTKKTREKLELHRDDVIEELEDCTSDDTFTEMLVKVWRDYEITGNGYIEIGRKADGAIGYLGHVPAHTIRVRRRRDGFVQVSGFKVQFFANYRAGFDEDGNEQDIANPIGDDTPNEIIHIKKYSPESSYYGVPDILAAQPALAGNKFAQDYNLDYFENKALPRYAIIVKGAKLSPAAERRLLAFFRSDLKGENHRSVVIPLPGDTDSNKVDLKFEAIEAGVQDSSFEKFLRQNQSEILMVHGVPLTKVSVADANLATAKDADKTFKEQVCAPQQKILQRKLYKLMREFSDALDLMLNEMSLTDENTQSQIDERRIKTGQRTQNELRTRDGLPAHDQGNELFDMNAQMKIAQMSDRTARAAQRANANATGSAPASAGANANGNPAGTRQRDTQRTANATDSAGAARNPKGEGRTTP
jgi:PBSX family phage portal protein